MRRTLMFGNTTVTIRIEKPIRVKRWEGLHHVNGHRISGVYEPGGRDLWPAYGYCPRCGQSVLNGADTYFASIPCGKSA